jgi:DNA mismatch repair protein MutH
VEDLPMAIATERVTVLMSPQEKQELVAQARDAGLSVGELVRRTMLARPSDAELEAELAARGPELEALLDAFEASNRRAETSLDAAQRSVRELVAYMKLPREQRAAD